MTRPVGNSPPPLPIRAPAAAGPSSRAGEPSAPREEPSSSGVTRAIHQNRRATLERLPPEVFALVAQHLDRRSIGALQLVSPSVKNLSHTAATMHSCEHELVRMAQHTGAGLPRKRQKRIRKENLKLFYNVLAKSVDFPLGGAGRARIFGSAAASIGAFHQFSRLNIFRQLLHIAVGRSSIKDSAPAPSVPGKEVADPAKARYVASIARGIPELPGHKQFEAFKLIADEIAALRNPAAKKDACAGVAEGIPALPANRRSEAFKLLEAETANIENPTARREACESLARIIHGLPVQERLEAFQLLVARIGTIENPATKGQAWASTARFIAWLPHDQRLEAFELVTTKIGTIQNPAAMGEAYAFTAQLISALPVNVRLQAFQSYATKISTIEDPAAKGEACTGLITAAIKVRPDQRAWAFFQGLAMARSIDFPENNVPLHLLNTLTDIATHLAEDLDALGPPELMQVFADCAGMVEMMESDQLRGQALSALLNPLMALGDSEETEAFLARIEDIARGLTTPEGKARAVENLDHAIEALESQGQVLMGYERAAQCFEALRDELRAAPAQPATN